MVVIIRFFQMNCLWHPYCLPLFRLSFWMSQTSQDCLCVCLLCFCLFLHVFWPECLNSHSNLHPLLWKKRMAETCWRHQRCWSATVSTNCIFFLLDLLHTTTNFSTGRRIVMVNVRWMVMTVSQWAQKLWFEAWNDKGNWFFFLFFMLFPSGAAQRISCLRLTPDLFSAF